MKSYLIAFILVSLSLFGCIKDDFIEDFVEPTLRITTVPDTILVNSEYQFEFMFLNNIGVEEEVNAVWSSSNTDIIEIDESGLALTKTIGIADIKVMYSNNEINLEEVATVRVGMSTVEAITERDGRIKTTSSYTLEGDFKLSENQGQLTIEFFEDYRASTALPGLYVYLSNNPNAIGNALEIGAVETFSGSHVYTLENIGINDYEYLVYFCKPFNVKVGDGTIN
ncbi:MAG: DM13 domain-containing protein [Saprospiraceae bacterium]|nr:DM13 domain-containing protein [Saprospiraceae bacterium]